MGETTLKIADIYRKYSMVTEELADHFAVESEFLAWLHGVQAGDTEAGKNFAYLLAHLRQWSEPYFFLEWNSMIGSAVIGETRRRLVRFSGG